MTATQGGKEGAGPNFTVTVNWREKGFGCVKVCSYCNWSTSHLLPQGPQPDNQVREFVRQCRKSFVTISGGGDPLYQVEKNRGHLARMAAIIREEGFRVRVITREVAHLHELRGLADHVSVSLDPDVMEEIPKHEHLWAGMDVEYSLVLPPLPTERIEALRPHYEGILARLRRRLVLRENLNSVAPPLDFRRLSFGHQQVVFVSKELCLSGRYLSKVDCTGDEIVQDMRALWVHLVSDPALYVFGGFAKHLLAPDVHPEFGDVDVLCTSEGSMRRLERSFGYTFAEVPGNGGNPKYFRGRPRKAGKEIQLLLVRDAEDARRFVLNAQYDVDRLYYWGSIPHFDQGVGTERITAAVRSKTATLLGGSRDRSLFFQPGRDQAEQRHRRKLTEKGFNIISQVGDARP